MKKKAVEVMFVFSFVLTGCGVESIFTSREALLTWIISAVVLLLCAKALGGLNDDE